MADMGNCIIELRGITKNFDDQQVLRGIDLNIYENQFLTLLTFRLRKDDDPPYHCGI